MNRKGITILELLVSMVLISIVTLLLIRITFTLENINNDKDYASGDEIARAEIIKNIENDFLKLKLNGLNIKKESGSTIINLYFENNKKDLVIKPQEVKYGDDVYTLKSNNAEYSLCPMYKYLDLENDYYYMEIKIPVLINGKNERDYDDLILTYIGLKNENTNYLNNYSC